jgi:phosphohistidine phosphatase
MKRLILMRHAKSDWSDASLSDHARTLNARGQRSAGAIGGWLRERGLIPDYVLCSDAVRTVQTLALLGLGEVPTTLTPALYLAEPDAMAALLRSQTEDTLLMLGHNPGTGALAEMLLAEAPDHPDFDRYPTCATLVAEFDIQTWSDLRNGTGSARHFIVPRQLTD